MNDDGETAPLAPRRPRLFRDRKHIVRNVVVPAAVIILALVGAFLVYANLVMQGDRTAALTAWNNPAITITSTDHSVIMTPTAPSAPSTTGLVFAPGAKVDPYAYMYKLSGVVEAGVTVVITKPILNFAILDQRPLTIFTDDVPGITAWYVGGHSLGGVRACALAADTTSTPRGGPRAVRQLSRE